MTVWPSRGPQMVPVLARPSRLPDHLREVRRLRGKEALRRGRSRVRRVDRRLRRIRRRLRAGHSHLTSLSAESAYFVDELADDSGAHSPIAAEPLAVVQSVEPGIRQPRPSVHLERTYVCEEPPSNAARPPLPVALASPPRCASLVLGRVPVGHTLTVGVAARGPLKRSTGRPQQLGAPRVWLARQVPGDSRAFVGGALPAEAHSAGCVDGESALHHICTTSGAEMGSTARNQA